MILVIDNYDSFTYNIVQEMGELGADIQVVRNDQVTVEQIRKMSPSHIVVSPGPGFPKDSGISRDVILDLGRTIPTLGVCLGHQCIGEVYGGVVSHAKKQMHGKISMIHHDSDPLFNGLSNPFQATRYHSLVVQMDTLPKELVVTAWTEDDEIMGLRHKYFPVVGVQFHPESILTLNGIQILKNFLEITPLMMY
jgi:anthranilate synthase/aminodeoxychorismate synthase-like glutamine amidotransferase